MAWFSSIFRLPSSPPDDDPITTSNCVARWRSSCDWWKIWPWELEFLSVRSRLQKVKWLSRSCNMRKHHPPIPCLTSCKQVSGAVRMLSPIHLFSYFQITRAIWHSIIWKIPRKTWGHSKVSADLTPMSTRVTPWQPCQKKKLITCPRVIFWRSAFAVSER